MGKIKRVWNVISGIVVILFAMFAILIPEIAFIFIGFIAAALLLIRGVRYIIYYLTMAQHMVGGKIIMFYGVFLFDLGFFAMTIFSEAKAVILIYLTAGHAISGGIDMIRSIRNRKDGYSSWRTDMIQGIGNILIAVICVIFVNSIDILVYVYSLGLIYLAIIRIVRAFRRSAIVYIQ